MNDDDKIEVGYQIDKAKGLLELAGPPTTRSEMFLAAQTHAIIALLVATVNPTETVTVGGEGFRQVSYPSVAKYPVTDLHMLGYCHNATIDINQAVEAMRWVSAQPYDWRMQKIQAIKDLRSRLACGLKEAKDIIDYSTNHTWWT